MRLPMDMHKVGPRRGTEPHVRFRKFVAACLWSLGILTTGAVTGCKDLGGTQALPSGTSDPASYNSVAGALGQRIAVLNAWIAEWPAFVVKTGALSDEFQSNGGGSGRGQTIDPDQRILPPGSPTLSVTHPTDADYNALHLVRGLARQAIGQLATYDSAASPALRGELYALIGYADIALADLFCSGVPLSTVDFQRDYTYAAPSTTAQVYQAAVAQFDSAIALSADSSRILNLAKIGKGRALLNLGQYAQAAQAVTSVPTTFRYQVSGRWGDSTGSGDKMQYLHASDQEGENGLAYISSGDPRSTAQERTVLNGGTRLSPTKIVGLLNAAGFVPMTIADGIEARLIEAEAAFHTDPNGSQWLTILNTLRTSGGTTFPGQTLVDTLGVTGCIPGAICGSYPGGSDSTFGQPAGGFPGYHLVSADTFTSAHTYFASDGSNVQDYCNAHSWYEPCYAGDTMVVQTYVSPAHTEWAAGTGGIAGLAQLSDPGAALSGQAATNARVDLLFQERAEWLFVTGHRQGDLRRLIRQYGRTSSTVYPVGPYPAGGLYGGSVVAPIPSAEYANPLFHGCIDYNA